MALGQRGEDWRGYNPVEEIIPLNDAVKLMRIYAAVTGTEAPLSAADFLEILREDFCLQGNFNRQNRFSNYIRRETHYEIERKGYRGEVRGWEVQGMTSHLYEMIRDEVLGRFVVSCNLILKERARRKEDNLSFLCDLALEKVAERMGAELARKGIGERFK